MVSAPFPLVPDIGSTDWGLPIIVTGIHVARSLGPRSPRLIVRAEAPHDACPMRSLHRVMIGRILRCSERVRGTGRRAIEGAANSAKRRSNAAINFAGRGVTRHLASNVQSDGK